MKEQSTTLETPSQGNGWALITVDVWDTLLRRRCHPDAVKLHVARYLILNYWSELPDESRDPWRLLRLRQEAEKLLGDACRSSGLDDEYRHQDVYRKWLELAGLDSAQVQLPAVKALVKAMEEIELAQEKKVTYVDPTIAEQLSFRKGRRVLFLSDFYLPEESLWELLAHHQIHDWLPGGGIVSCDVGLNKRSGRLFQYVHTHLNVDPGQHLHIGDNLHSDVLRAQDHGVTAFHYLPKEEHSRRLAHEATFHDRQAGLRKALNGLSLTNPSDLRCQEAYAYGQKWSLLLIGFILNVMELAVADRVDRLYFFTREGEFFLKLYEQLASSDVLGFPVSPARLLHVSRLATFAASLREFSPQELMRLWNQYSVQSLSALFKSLGMKPDSFAAMAGRHGLTLEDPITYPWQDPDVLTFFQDPDLQAMIKPELAAKKAILRSYLDSAGISETDSTIGIVDIGWRGTIQDNLAYAVPSVSWQGYYLGLSGLLNEQPQNLHKTAYGPDANRSDPASHLLDFVAPIEMLCNSPHGSVTGYEQLSSGVKALLHIDEDENRIHDEYVRDFQRGVLDSVPYWADYCRTHAVTSAEIRPMALETWSEMLQAPPAFLAEAYFRLKHNETFGMGNFIDKSHSLSTPEVLLALVSRKARGRLVVYLRDIGWLPGLHARLDATASFRFSLRLVLWLSKTKHRTFEKLQKPRQE